MLPARIRCARCMRSIYLTYSFNALLKSKAWSRSRNPTPINMVRSERGSCRVDDQRSITDRLSDRHFKSQNPVPSYLEAQHIITRAVNNGIDEVRHILSWFYHYKYGKKWLIHILNIKEEKTKLTNGAFAKQDHVFLHHAQLGLVDILEEQNAQLHSRQKKGFTEEKKEEDRRVSEEGEQRESNQLYECWTFSSFW